MTIFTTERILVRRYNIFDADNFSLLNGDEEVVRYIRPAVNRKESDAFLQKNIEFYDKHPGLGRFAAEEIATGKFLGSFALIPVENTDGEIQIGYAFIPEAWGRGYATEITKAGIDFFFSTQNADVLYAITETPNTASQKVLLKCGFEFYKNLKEAEKDLIKFVIGRKK